MELSFALRNLPLELPDLLVSLGHLKDLVLLKRAELFDLRTGPLTLAIDPKQMGGASRNSGYSCGLFNHVKYLRVDGDAKILAVGQLLAAFFNSLANEFRERISNHRVRYVQNPLKMERLNVACFKRKIFSSDTYLSRQRWPVSFLWEVVADFCKLRDEFENLFYAERRVLGCVEVTHVLRLDGPFPFPQNLLHKVDVNSLERRQVEGGIDSKEAKLG